MSRKNPTRLSRKNVNYLDSGVPTANWKSQNEKENYFKEPKQNTSSDKPGVQPIKECNQCSFVKPGGERCKLKPCATFPYCHIHLMYQEGLRVKKSNIPNAGMGLFAVKDFDKGDLIAPYSGDRLTKKQFDQRYPGNDAQYVLEIKTKDKKGKTQTQYIDSRNTQSHVGRYANNIRNMSKEEQKQYGVEQNAKLTGPDEHAKTAEKQLGGVTAIKDIHASRQNPKEIMVDYGSVYDAFKKSNPKFKGLPEEEKKQETKQETVQQETAKPAKSTEAPRSRKTIQSPSDNAPSPRAKSPDKTPRSRKSTQPLSVPSPPHISSPQPPPDEADSPGLVEETKRLQQIVTDGLIVTEEIQTSLPSLEDDHHDFDTDQFFDLSNDISEDASDPIPELKNPSAFSQSNLLLAVPISKQRNAIPIPEPKKTGYAYEKQEYKPFEWDPKLAPKVAKKLKSFKLPAPRSWKSEQFPKGMNRYPVSEKYYDEQTHKKKGHRAYLNIVHLRGHRIPYKSEQQQENVRIANQNWAHSRNGKDSGGKSPMHLMSRTIKSNDEDHNKSEKELEMEKEMEEFIANMKPVGKSDDVEEAPELDISNTGEVEVPDDMPTPQGPDMTEEAIEIPDEEDAIDISDDDDDDDAPHAEETDPEDPPFDINDYYKEVGGRTFPNDSFSKFEKEKDKYWNDSLQTYGSLWNPETYHDLLRRREQERQLYYVTGKKLQDRIDKILSMKLLEDEDKGLLLIRPTKWHHSHVTAESIYRLKNKKWIDDPIVDLFAYLIHSQLNPQIDYAYESIGPHDQKWRYTNHIPAPYFSLVINEFKNLNADDLTTSMIELPARGSANYNGFKNFAKDINKMDMYFIPLYYQKNHWMLMCIALTPEYKIIVMDPMGSEAYDTDPAIKNYYTRMAHRFMLELFYAGEHKYYESMMQELRADPMAHLKYIAFAVAPRQPNKIDCGPYICRYMDIMARNEKFSKHVKEMFAPKNLREWILMSILDLHLPYDYDM
jgi:hypothetical protein